VAVRHELSSFPRGVPEGRPKDVRPNDKDSVRVLQQRRWLRSSLERSYRLSPATASAWVAAESLVRGENW